MKLSIKKRLALGAAALATVGAVTTLAAGVTFGLFSASNTQTGTNTFTSLTVSQGSPATATCTVANIVAGDSSANFSPLPTGQTDTPTAECTFQVTNTSTAPTYVGVVLAPTGTLYDGTPSGLQYQVHDGSTNYTTGGALNNSGGTAASPLLFSTTPDAGGANTVHTVHVNWALPITTTDHQNLTSTLTVTIEAVQSGNNGNVAAIGACTAGSQCGAITAWS